MASSIEPSEADQMLEDFTEQIASFSADKLRVSLPDFVESLEEAGLSVGKNLLDELEDIENLTDGELYDLGDGLGRLCPPSRGCSHTGEWRYRAFGCVSAIPRYGLQPRKRTSKALGTHDDDRMAAIAVSNRPGPPRSNQIT
jgi:hypothetical protein